MDLVYCPLSFVNKQKTPTSSKHNQVFLSFVLQSASADGSFVLNTTQSPIAVCLLPPRFPFAQNKRPHLNSRLTILQLQKL